MSGFRYSTPYQTALDSAGVTLPGALLYFYQSGTATPLASYSDAALSLPNTNPVVSDAGGLFPNIFLQSGVDYKVILKDADGNQLWQADPVSGGGATIAIETVATIAALRALSVSSDTLTSIIYVRGYYADNDGGEGFFLCTNQNPGADNGGTIIRSNTAGFYYLRSTDLASYSVKWFGAKGVGTDDVTAISAALDAAYGVGFNAIYFPIGTYGISSKLAFKADLLGADQTGVIIQALSGFSMGYMLDFNVAVGQGRQMENITWDLRSLGSGSAVTTFGSSSAGGGGGSFLTVGNNIRILSSSSTKAAFTMASSISEPGALAFSTWTNLCISSPRCISLGNNQNNVLFLNGEMDNATGGVSVPIETASGANNISFIGTAFEFVDAATAFFNIGTGHVVFDNCFVESTSNIVNTPWLFLCNQTGSRADPETRLFIRALSLNYNYTGVDVDAAIIAVTVDNTAAVIRANYNQYIDIDGIHVSTGGGLPPSTLFNIYNAANADTGPLVLTIENVDRFDLSLCRTGSTAAAFNKVQLRGHWFGINLNHTGTIPAPGNRLTWTWQLPAANFTG